MEEIHVALCVWVEVFRREHVTMSHFCSFRGGSDVMIKSSFVMYEAPSA